jgi:biotin synthase
MEKLLVKIEEKILREGKDLLFPEAEALLKVKGAEQSYLFAIANKVKEKYWGNEVDVCSIINAKSGGCSEDCKFCAQSAHYSSSSLRYPLLEIEKIVESASRAQKWGSSHFCIVTSGNELSDSEFQKVLLAIKEIKKRLPIKVDCSLGSLSLEEARLLKEAGVSRYNHNVETTRDYFSSICTTHSYASRVETINNLKKVGISVCCGGIIGLGETLHQRLKFAFELKELNGMCVPINILSPRPKTPLENSPPLPPLEIVKTIAIFRLILPDKIIKIAGGRERNLRSLQALALLAGANGFILGDYLTTQGQPPEQDLEMVRDLELVIR